MRLLSRKRKKRVFMEAACGPDVAVAGAACGPDAAAVPAEAAVIGAEAASGAEQAAANDSICYGAKERSKIWVIGAVVVASFLLCRVVVMDHFLPCGIALLTVLMSRDRLNVYMLPAMLIGMGTFYVRGLYFWGDLAAVIACAVVFIIIGNKRLGLVGRALIAASIAVIANCAYYMAAHMLYRFSMPAIFWEVFSILGLCWIFHVFLELTGIRLSMLHGEKERQRTEISAAAGIASVSLILSLLFCGIGSYHISLVACLFLTLLFGYKMGIMEGVMSGTACGMVLLLTAGGTPGMVVVLMFGGFMAGFFKGQNRVSAAICFAAACLGLGMLREFPELYMPLLDPLIAGVILILMPSPLLRAVDKILVKLVQEEAYGDYVGRDKFLKLLNGYRRSFSSLAGLYAAPKDSRSIVSYQFKGMTQVVEKMIREIDGADGKSFPAETAARFNVTMGEAGYAKEGNVSGDSYLCRELPGEKFVIVLSDGMGKGETAAAESSLAVTTIANLLEAGFDVELAIKTINSILLLKSEEEIFSTVDIGMFDKVTGRLRLFKIGAAHTFIKRGDRVQAVKVSALPLGIVDGLHIDFVNVRLHPGDEIIMVSDGITDSDRSDANLDWLTESIASIKSRDPQTMCDLILNKAVENYGVREKDDLTVLTARID